MMQLHTGADHFGKVIKRGIIKHAVANEAVVIRVNYI
jgi:hypothetical protein